MSKEMVTPGRLELPTRSLGNCCSIHLSYGATFYIIRSSYRKLLGILVRPLRAGAT